MKVLICEDSFLKTEVASDDVFVLLLLHSGKPFSCRVRVEECMQRKVKCCSGVSETRSRCFLIMEKNFFCIYGPYSWWRVKSRNGFSLNVFHENTCDNKENI